MHTLDNIHFLRMVVLSKQSLYGKILVELEEIEMTVKSFWIEILASNFHIFLVMMLQRHSNSKNFYRLHFLSIVLYCSQTIEQYGVKTIRLDYNFVLLDS